MPWKETDVMNQKTEFVLRAMRGVEGFGDLCREYGISRKTGYKWKQRFIEQGLEGLGDQSRRPHSSPSEIGDDLVCRIVKMKLAHPSWGPKKIRALIARAEPERDLPSESSFKRILDKAGLVQRRRRRGSQEQGGRVTTPVRSERPNQVWTVDFKGWWYTRNQSRFEPLTIRDDFSRHLLCAQALENARTETVRAQFEQVFGNFGLPEVIRSDNGAPFAARQSPLGLSRLSAWWLSLGIDLDRIPPGRPDQNGGHERMHRDLAWELEGSAEVDLATQQASLDVWRETFNQERPHEALGMQVPQDVYCRSNRVYDSGEVELSYPAGQLVRKVTRRGLVTVRNTCVSVSVALGGFEVGLESLGVDRLAVWFRRLCLGEIDLASRSFQARSTN